MKQTDNFYKGYAKSLKVALDVYKEKTGFSFNFSDCYSVITKSLIEELYKDSDCKQHIFPLYNVLKQSNSEIILRAVIYEYTALF